MLSDRYADAKPVRTQLLVPQDLGTGWRTLHALAELHGVPPRLEVLALLRWALWRSQQGDDTRLTLAQFNEMLGLAEPLETVA